MSISVSGLSDPALTESRELPANRLERLLGRTPSAWTIDDLVGLFDRQRLRLVSLMHVGGDGWLKTLDFVPRDLAHLRDVLAFGNRAGNSFVRLSQAKEAPDRVTWGRFNRKALVRLPIVARDDRGRSVSPETVEFRLPDGSAHPHLLLAGIAQAMIAGRACVSGDLLKRTSAESGGTAPLVPRSFAQVADGLREHRATLETGGVFPAHVIDRLLALVSQQA